MKTLVTGALETTPEELNMLRSLGLEITFHQDERQPVICPEQYEAVVCNGLFVWNDISNFTNLRYIQLTSTGYDRMPMDYAKAHSIAVHNAAGVYSTPMAEWTLMALLALLKNAEKIWENQHSYRWEKDRSWQELAGKTACIVGFGAYGLEVAKRLKSFDVTVHVVNRTHKDSPYIDFFYPLENLDQVLSTADIIILAIALTEETRGLIGVSQLSHMKPNSFLINAARGALLDESALTEMLQSGYLAGAALDVFDQEPLPENSPLWKLPNVILSPHNSFVSNRNHHRLLELITENLKKEIVRQER